MKAVTLMAAAAMVIVSPGCKAQDGNAGGGNTPLNVEPVKPPPGGDWAQVVSQTPAGGFVMGNPNARVKLIEFGSMTCPHCREFDENGVQPLIDKYVKTGHVSFEFRNFVRDPFDLAASLIARCNGASGFFPLTRALFKDQPTWIAKLQSLPPDQFESLQALGPDQQFRQVAQLAGFQDWATVRGLPAAKSNACLSNQAEIDRLVQMTSNATTEFPDLKGTPTFVINGKIVDAPDWKTLEPQLRNAVGG